MEACFPPVVLDCVRTWCTNNNLMGSPGQYHGFCARSCAYCGPTGTPTFTPPTLVPSTMVPSTSQIPTALCNDGFLLRDAKKFLRRKLGLPELCVNSWSSTSCCRGLQRHGECKAELADDGILFGYCSRTCGYCGFEAYDFQEHHFEPEPLSHVHLDSEEVMGKVSSFVVCGAIAAGFFCACLVALLLFLNHTFDTSNAKLKRGAKLVALSTLCFTGSAFLVAGVGCAPDTAMRNAHGVLNDLEIDEMDLSVVAENVHISFTASVTALVQNVGFRSRVELAAARLIGQYIHGGKTLRLGALGWETTEIEPDSQKQFSTKMNSTFYRDDFWGAWMATDYYSNQFKLEFGPTTVQFDLVPDNVIVKWVLGSSDTSISYSYACNYTVFVQALFLNSMSCRLAPRAVTEGVEIQCLVCNTK
mmetsp:Transcript_19728/g.61789  ORF Transcript_19728/g.61789 Transcript_19728/m.61789 type:complete len:417 (+) Transcript_19728:629-1879(+)